MLLASENGRFFCTQKRLYPKWEKGESMNENERRENLITEIVKLLRELPVAVVRELYAVALEHKKNNAGRKAE